MLMGCTVCDRSGLKLPCREAGAGGIPSPCSHWCSKAPTACRTSLKWRRPAPNLLMAAWSWGSLQHQHRQSVILLSEGQSVILLSEGQSVILLSECHSQSSSLVSASQSSSSVSASQSSSSVKASQSSSSVNATVNHPPQ
ncbi:hypothetical protein ACOMHN_018422 [Nucella lapillus]